MTRSVEHVMSLEPQDMTAFVQAIRDLEVAMGSNRRMMSAEEKEGIMAVRRSAFLGSDTKAGTPIAQADIVFRRPGFGIPPDQFERFESGVITSDLSAGHMLGPQDISMKGV